MDLSNLKAQLQTLANQAADIDRRRGESAKPLFDERLFTCLSRLLTPCVMEAQAVVTTLEREHSAGKLSGLRAEHLCEKLLNQIGALQKGNRHPTASRTGKSPGAKTESVNQPIVSGSGTTPGVGTPSC